MAKARILVIDDDAEIRDIARAILEPEGYEVQAATTGEQGLRLATEAPPDLILLDLMLPGLNGLEVCRTIRRTSRVPIIMVTARAAAPEKVVGLEAGADDYLTKPFSIAELRARIHALLRRTAPAG
jgi:DNA-binding response OmpR family regulator